MLSPSDKLDSNEHEPYREGGLTIKPTIIQSSTARNNQETHKKVGSLVPEIDDLEKPKLETAEGEL